MAAARNAVQRVIPLTLRESLKRVLCARGE